MYVPYIGWNFWKLVEFKNVIDVCTYAHLMGNFTVYDFFVKPVLSPILNAINQFIIVKGTCQIFVK